LDADRCRTLNEMEKLAKGQRDKPEHHHHFVRRRDIPVVRTTQPGAISSQRRVAAKVLVREKELPAPAPVAARRWARQPEAVLVGHCCGGKDRGHRVANERGIEPVKATGAQGNQSGEDGGGEDAKQHGAGAPSQRRSLRWIWRGLGGLSTSGFARRDERLVHGIASFRSVATNSPCVS